MKEFSATIIALTFSYCYIFKIRKYILNAETQRKRVFMRVSMSIMVSNLFSLAKFLAKALSIQKNIVNLQRKDV